MWLFKRPQKKHAAKYYPKLTKERLIEILVREIENLDSILDRDPPIEKYPEASLANVLLASGAYYQHLKISRRRLRKKDLDLLEYLSTVSPRETTFPASCLRLHEQLKQLPGDSALTKVKTSELLNLYVFLLSRLEE